MQEKTIKAVLRRKIDDWTTHVRDERLKELIQNEAICTGGAITSLLVGEQPNDFDIYFKTKETTKAVAEYYVSKFKENPPSRFKSSPDHLVKIRVQDDEGRIKIVIKSQGIAGESGTETYQYFEQVQDPTEPEEFVEQVAQDKAD